MENRGYTVSQLKMFDVNGKEIGEGDVQINAINFKDYKKQYGKARAEGYADAFRDLFLAFEKDVMTNPNAANSNLKMRSDSGIATMAQNFWDDKLELLRSIAQQIGKPSFSESPLMAMFDKEFKPDK